MRAFFTRFPVISRLFVAAIVVALIGLLVWGAWTLAYDQGWISKGPTWDIASLFGPEETPDSPTGPATVTQAPAAQPTAEPTKEPKATKKPATQPTKKPKTKTETHATYKNGKEIKVEVDGKKVTFITFTYSGGYNPKDDPWFGKNKETENSYGPAIYGKSPQELTYNWLRELCKSPHQVIRLRVQMGLDKYKSLKEENAAALKLAAKSPEGYDKVVNTTMKAFFEKLENGRIEQSTDWALENYMLATDKNGSKEISLHGRQNGDDDTKDKDVLLTFYAKGSDTTFVSAKQGFVNTATDAGVNTSQFSQRAWVNMTEGGTWKWKSKGSGHQTDPTPDPTTTQPPAPTVTPTPAPRPTKDPNLRPTPPIGGGETDPEHSTDPKTTDHTESTPKPKTTKKPKPTAEPTAVPTAVVRPTEQCQTVAPTPIREDEATPPPSDPKHQVPKTETEGEGGDFNPDSV